MKPSDRTVLSLVALSVFACGSDGSTTLAPTGQGSTSAPAELPAATDPAREGRDDRDPRSDLSEIRTLSIVVAPTPLTTPDSARLIAELRGSSLPLEVTPPETAGSHLERHVGALGDATCTDASGEPLADSTDEPTIECSLWTSAGFFYAVTLRRSGPAWEVTHVEVLPDD